MHLTDALAPVGHHKLIFGGPVGAGKTTAIGAASDIPPLRTEAPILGGPGQSKPFTGAVLDYGAMTLGDGCTLHLYGTPGRERFDFMWELLTEDALALILLIDNSRPDALDQLHFHLGAFSRFIRDTALSVGITHCDLGGGLTLDDYQAELEGAGFGCVPVFVVDPRCRRDVCLLIEAALSVLDPVARA